MCDFFRRTNPGGGRLQWPDYTIQHGLPAAGRHAQRPQGAPLPHGFGLLTRWHRPGIGQQRTFPALARRVLRRDRLEGGAMKTRKAIMSYTTRRNLSVWVLSMHGGYWIPTSALTARSIFALRTRVRLISSSSDRGPVSE